MKISKEYHDLDTASKAFKIPKSTLRYWERRGLIKATRAENNYRMYSRNDFIEISDIKLYRDADVPISDIARLKTMKPQELELYYERLTENLKEQINSLQQAQRMIAQRRRMLLKYRELEEYAKKTIFTAEELGIREVRAYDIYNEKHSQVYMEDPYTNRYILFFAKGYYETPVDGWILEGDEIKSSTLWEKSSHDSKFMCMLLKADADNPYINNLQELLDVVRREGYQPGAIICSYLFDGCLEGDTKQKSIYQALIEI